MAELHDAYGNHVSTLGTYLKVYVALLVLTVVTVGVSYIELGDLSFAVAMIVALTKASVVAAYFMHLKYEDRLYSFVLLAAVFFVGLFFMFTYIDLFSRDKMDPVEDNFYYQQDQQWETRILDGEVQPSAPPPAEDPAAGDGAAQDGGAVDGAPATP